MRGAGGVGQYPVPALSNDNDADTEPWNLNQLESEFLAPAVATAIDPQRSGRKWQTLTHRHFANYYVLWMSCPLPPSRTHAPVSDMRRPPSCINQDLGGHRSEPVLHTARMRYWHLRLKDCVGYQYSSCVGEVAVSSRRWNADSNRSLSKARLITHVAVQRDIRQTRATQKENINKQTDKGKQ
jgi:hypothetical protein